jgi:hypothetical protein
VIDIGRELHGAYLWGAVSIAYERGTIFYAVSMVGHEETSWTALALCGTSMSTGFIDFLQPFVGTLSCKNVDDSVEDE